MATYSRVPGVRVEQIGSGWAAFSPLSGETLLLNDSSAAVLECLEHGPADDASIARELADDAGMTQDAMARTLHTGWDALVSTGLVRRNERSVSPSK